jgi:Uma2 family endonuclease
MSKVSSPQPSNTLQQAWLPATGREPQAGELPQRYKFTLEQYHQLGETGIINPDIRMELIRGELVLMAPKGTPHEVCLTRLIRVLLRAVGQQAVVRVQSPVIIPPDSEPEPDFTIARLRDDEYLDEHPQGRDAHLLIEVSASSLYIDRTIKQALYAEASVEHYWIFDISARLLEAYSSPQLLCPNAKDTDQRFGYGNTQIFTDADSISIPGLENAQVNLMECFPPVR